MSPGAVCVWANPAARVASPGADGAVWQRPGGHRLSVAPTNAPTCPVGMNGLRFVGGFGHVTVATAALVLPVEVRVPHEGGTVRTDPTLQRMGGVDPEASRRQCHAVRRADHAPKQRIARGPRLCRTRCTTAVLMDHLKVWG